MPEQTLVRWQEPSGAHQTGYVPMVEGAPIYRYCGEIRQWLAVPWERDPVPAPVFGATDDDRYDEDPHGYE